MAARWISKMHVLYSFLFLLLVVYNISLLNFIPKEDFNTIQPQHSLLINGSLEEFGPRTDVSITLATNLLSTKHNSNVVFSPLSIRVILSIVAAGSSGQTLDQLLAFLKTNTTDDLNSLYSQLVSSILADDDGQNGGSRLSFANGLWVDKTLSLKPYFQQVVDTVYKAAFKQVDFQNKVEVANEMNLWAEEQTNGLIKEVIHADAINRDTNLIFANAVYFKGAWSEKFDKSKTKESHFHLLDGNKVQVPFMTSNKYQFVCEYADFKVLRLPYEQGHDKCRFTMYFVLPDAKDGLQSLVLKIGSTPDFFEHHIPRQKVPVGEFFIPKFKISFGFEASAMLKELGLVSPFNGRDGFMGMVDSSVGQSLFVSSIHHKSFVEVNEEGTEAAAVTLLHMAFGMKPDFVADHPFLFVVREDVTGIVLFMGQVVNPRLC